MYALGGLTFSVLFQYYRPIPLWIPIKWNTLFLLINSVMIAQLVMTINDAQNMPEEKKDIYEKVFRDQSMTTIDFLRLLGTAERREVKKGERLLSLGSRHNQIHLIQSGRFSIRKAGMSTKVDYSSYQFLGALSFLTWEGNHRTKQMAKKKSNTSFMSSEGEGYVQQLLGSLSQSSHGGDDPSYLNSVYDEEGEDGEVGLADVTCEEDGVVYSWQFQDVEYLLDHEPQLGLIMERCLSVDLSKKLDRNWTVENVNRYRYLLTWAVSDGEVNDKEKVLLDNFRSRHSIAMSDHVAILKELGWSSEEFNVGSKCAASPDQLCEYFELQEQLLKDKVYISHKNKMRLLEYRRRNRVSFEHHGKGLHRLGWSEDEFEAGRLAIAETDLIENASASNEVEPNSNSKIRQSLQHQPLEGKNGLQSVTNASVYPDGASTASPVTTSSTTSSTSSPSSPRDPRAGLPLVKDKVQALGNMLLNGPRATSNEQR
jgi:hypothetical protein